MAIEWSERQKSAIFTKDKNILVSASAGSGKTAVLSERIVNLVMDERIDIDKFVVVTFTRLAASEMKSRIAKKLNKRKENATKEEKDFIDEQIILLEKANISTLDSFNISLLRDYFYMIDLEPNFKVIDNVDNELLAKDIMDKLFDKYYKEHDEKFLKLIAMYSAERTDDGLKNVIRELYNYITNVPDSDYVLDNLLNEYDAENIENSIYYKTFIEYANKILDEYINDLKDYIDIHDILLNELKLLKDLKDAINESYDKAYDIIYAKEKFETLRFPKDTDESTKTYVKKIREDYKSFFDKLKKKYFKSNSEKFKEEVSYMKPYLERLVSLTKEYKEMLFNDKKKNNIYDFNDLAHLTIKLLVDDNGNPTDIAKSLKKTYSYIICDEYQDVNLIQETILNAIARSGKESNMFMVGDVKQSIYGFRNADSDIFTNKYNDYKSNRDDNNMKIDLNQNYRSRIEVLNSINYVFEKIMLSDIGGIEYDEEMALRYGDGYIENDMDHKTEFIILPTARYLNQKAKEEAKEDLKEENKETNTNDNSNDENQSDEISEEINELKNGIIQAKYITNKIKELFDNKTEVMYEENDEKKFRPIEYKDIAILYRGIGQDAKALFDELKNNNIPCVISKQDNFMDELDVKLTIAMLRVIDNPYDNVAYVTTLYSDLYKFNPEELMLLKKRNKYKVSFYQMIEEEIKLIKNNTSDLEINLINKIKNVNETYNHLKTFSIKNSLEDLVKEIYDIFNKEKYFLGFMNMKNKVDNMNLFLTYAKKYEASGSKNIYDFIKTIKQIEETKKKVELTTPMETGNAITIMTIHKSKGLEFPIVFMPSLEKLFKKEDLNGKTLIEKELGYITKYIDTKKAYLKTNLFFETVREKLNEELIAEEMRIFYVAMTRAKEKLYMIGSYVEAKTKGNIYLDMIKNNKIKYRDITTAISPLDFFMPCIYQSNTLDTEKNMIVVDEREFVPKDMNEETKLSPMRILFNEIKDEESKNKSMTYDHIDATIVKQKVSVTEIKKRKMAEINLNEIDDKETDEEMILESIKPDEEIYKPKSDILKQITRGDRNKLTPAEKGTLMHKLAKIINDKDIDKEFNRLIENNIFKKEELDQIDKEKIIMYLNSNTFERIDKSNFVKREMPFMMKKKASEIYKDKNIQDDVIIQGIVDCIFEEDNEIVILDYKTDKVFKEGITKEDRINEIKNNYKVQLDLYEEAVSKIYNKPIKEKILYLFDSGDTVKY